MSMTSIPEHVQHTDDGRHCSRVEGTGEYVYYDDLGRHVCDREHRGIEIPKPPEPEPARSYDDVTVGDVLEGERPTRYPNEPTTARGVLLSRLAYNLDQQDEHRRQADRARQTAEGHEESAEALEPVIREIEDAVRVLDETAAVRLVDEQIKGLPDRLAAQYDAEDPGRQARD